MYCNIFTHQGENYEVLNRINTSAFVNKNGQINQKVLGMYVHEFNANRVVQEGGKLIILKEIEDATIYEI